MDRTANPLLPALPRKPRAAAEKQRRYKDEIEVLKHHDISFARAAPPGGVRASTRLLLASGARTVLFFGERGRRADFAALAQALGFPHLSLAPRLDACDLMRQTLATLSPMGLAFYDLEPFPVAADGALMRQAALGFATGGGASVWLTPVALCDLVTSLGFDFRIVDCAKEGGQAQ